MGSGHFLVEACRYLGEALYEACRLCDERALEAEDRAEKTKDPSERARVLEQARALRQRVEDLPDPNDELVAYLPSRAAEGEESGLSQKKAEALCRRLVAVHCLYGVDKNPLAVELAKLSLWLESYAEGWPLTFLDHRLICGDSLSGPFLSDLLTLPVSGAPLGDDLLTQGLREKLEEALGQALARVKDLIASIGKDVADLELKVQAKADLDGILHPFRRLSYTWTQIACSGASTGDNDWLMSLESMHSWPEDPACCQDDADEFPVAWELQFPEAFSMAVSGGSHRGFDVVVGNPPWDKTKLEPKQILSSFDLDLLDSQRKSEWGRRIEEILLSNQHARTVLQQAEAAARGFRRISARLYPSTEFGVDGVAASGDRDLFMMFVVRGTDLLAGHGRIGMVVSGGLAKNPAATSVRKRLMAETCPVYLLQFDNKQGLFSDLPRIVEFCLSVSSKRRGEAFRFALRLSSFADLERVRNYEAIPPDSLPSRFGPMLIPKDEQRTGPLAGTSIRKALDSLSLKLGTDIHRTSDEHSFRSIAEILGSEEDGRRPSTLGALVARGYHPVRSGRSVGQFDDTTPTKHPRWDTRALDVISAASLNSDTTSRLRYYRLTFRETCGSPKSNERSMIAGVLPPGNVATHKLFVETHPAGRPHKSILHAAAVLNSFPIDHLIRPRIQTSISMALLTDCKWPTLDDRVLRILTHHALRLVSVHDGYQPLWIEQLGDAWREPSPRQTWPVFADDDARWAVRAAIDAVVADAYGLSRELYTHVLGDFSHRSYPKAPDLCLAAYDELKSIGLDAFVRKHDPYWDIPLVETLPKPVIDLPMPEGAAEDTPASPPPRRAQTALPLSRPAPPADDGQAYVTLRDLLAARGLISSGDAQQAAGLDAAGVLPHLQRLVAEGLAVTEGQRRGMKYRWVGDA